MKVSELFCPEPESWGLRGDPYFWRYLRDRLANSDMPCDPGRLEDFIKKEHLRLSGKEMTPISIAKVKMFEHGGMSSGGLSGDFWLNRGIPLLKERCVSANRALKDE